MGGREGEGERRRENGRLRRTGKELEKMGERDPAGAAGTEIAVPTTCTAPPHLDVAADATQGADAVGAVGTVKLQRTHAQG